VRDDPGPEGAPFGDGDGGGEVDGRDRDVGDPDGPGGAIRAIPGRAPAEYRRQSAQGDEPTGAGEPRRRRADDRLEASLLDSITRALLARGPLDIRREALPGELAGALGLSAAVLWLPHGEVLVARTTWALEGIDGAPLAASVREVPVERGTGLAGSAWEREEPLYQTRQTARESTEGRAPGTGVLWALTAIPAHTLDEVLGVVELYAPFQRQSSATLPSLSPAAHLLGSVLDRWRVQVPLARLTPRELELLTLASHGLTTAKIAERLSLSPWTVKTHFEHIRVKLDVGDRTAAVAKSLRAGTIE
jgi:DNA-binding CsgD family transcriptional regulator